MRTRGQARRWRGAHLALALLTWVGVFGAAWFRGGVFLERDLYSFHRPLKALLVPLALASDGLPSWNPWLAGGQPFAANPQQQLWHPFTALFYLLPFECAMAAHVLLPSLLGGLLVWVWQRARGRSAAAAALSTLAWSCGGVALSSWHLLPLSLGAMALPAVAWAARAAACGQRRGVPALACAFFLLAAAGEPSTLLVGPLVAWAAAAETRTPRWRALLAGLTWGLALAAVVLLPALALWSRSARAAGLARDEAGLWALHPWRLIEPFVRWSVFATGEGVDPLGLHAGRNTPFLASLYVGLLACGLAGLACAPRVGWRSLLWRRGLRPYAWVGVALLALLLALGPHAPGGAWWHALPPLSGLRFPERFMVLFGLVLALLAGDGWDRLRAILRRRARPLRVLVFGLIGVPAAVAALVLNSAARLAGDLGATLLHDGSRLLMTVAGATCAVALLARRPRLAGLALLAPALDLLLAGQGLVRTRPAADAGEPLVLERLRASGVRGPIFNEAGWLRASGESYRLGLLRPPLPAQWGWATQLEPDFDRSESVVARDAKQRTLALLAALPRVGEQTLRRRGVRIRLRLRGDVAVRSGRLRPPTAADTLVEPRLLESPAPTAFLAEHVAWLASEAEWERTLAALGTSAARSVLVERVAAQRAGWPTPTAPMDAAPFVLEARAPGMLRPRLERANAFEWDVEAPASEGAVLAFGQTWDPGWVARLDGQPCALVRVDLALMAVRVPPGSHRLTLRYVDVPLRLGLALTLAALVALLVLLGQGTLRRS